jgi:CBS domain-containing protein
MYVGLKMLKDFRKVTPKTPVKDADRFLRESDLWMLLVVDDESGELVGYVRKEDIAMALPSVMTTLEKHEALYLLAKLTVGRIMRRDITVVPPEMDIEAAAEIMYQKNLAGLAVVDSRASSWVTSTARRCSTSWWRRWDCARAARASSSRSRTGPGSFTRFRASSRSSA